jgi:hypothetical protein
MKTILSAMGRRSAGLLHARGELACVVHQRRYGFLSVALWFTSLTLLPLIVLAQVQHLNDSVRHAILTENFKVVVHVKDIPSSVLSAASKARGPDSAAAPLELAEPGAEFQATDVIDNPKLPGRRFDAGYASDDYFIMRYEVGGIAHTFHVAVFRLSGKNASFVWQAQVPSSLTGLDDLRKLLRNPDSTALDDSYTRFY